MENEHFLPNQIISKYRSEQCCMVLISSLLATCKTDLSSSAESDTSSVEVLKALTSHMTSASPLNLSQLSLTKVNSQHDFELNVSRYKHKNIDIECHVY